MIAGPNQSGRTLIELYAQKLSADPKSAAELFTAGATFGKAPVQQALAGLPGGRTYRVTAHLPAKGEDNYAELTVEGPGAAKEVQTVRFRNDGHSLTELEITGTRKG